MKLKYIFASLVAVAALAVSCSEEKDHYLDEITVSESTLAISEAGGSGTITLNATGAWSLTTELPSWLTLSPTSGSAGQTTLTFTADIDTVGGRQTYQQITCGTQSQYIRVLQGDQTIEVGTCADVIAAPDGKSFRVTGVCTGIANTTYGNWYLTDDTGTIYIYGTVNSSNSYAWSSFNIEVGDVVTVEGPKTTYGSTIELVDAKFISVKKSLVKMEAGDAFSFDDAGGDFAVKLIVKGNGLAVTIPDAAKEWISISDISVISGKADTTVVSFHVDPNEGSAARGANIDFTSASGSSSSTVSTSVSQSGLKGTSVETPFTIAEVIEYCNLLTGNSSKEFYVKGKVSRIANNGEFGSYGNATFFLSDDGEFLGTDDRNPDKAHDFEAYRVLYFGNEKWTEGHAQIAVGDEVIVYGTLTLYNGISETASGKAYVYSINGVTDDADGVGNVNAPFNVAGAEKCIDAGCTNNVYVAGIISQIAKNGQFGATYGNGTFWISDDGSYHDDAAKDFEAYRVLWLGNRKWTTDDPEVAVGDSVILCGLLTKYGTTYETSSGKAYVYSHNGKTE